MQNVARSDYPWQVSCPLAVRLPRNHQEFAMRSREHCFYIGLQPRTSHQRPCLKLSSWPCAFFKPQLHPFCLAVRSMMQSARLITSRYSAQKFTLNAFCGHAGCFLCSSLSGCHRHNDKSNVTPAPGMFQPHWILPSPYDGPCAGPLPSTAAGEHRRGLAHLSATCSSGSALPCRALWTLHYGAQQPL